MANPIPLNLPPRDPRRELEVRLQNAPMQHAEAILDGYEVIQQLHESGAFNILRGMLGEKDKVIEQTVHAINTPDMVRGMRNLTVLVTALGEIDPVALQAMTLSFSQALTETKENACDPPGFWSLLSSFRGKDLRRGLVLVNTLLEKFGRNLCPERNENNEQQK